MAQQDTTTIRLINISLGQSTLISTSDFNHDVKCSNPSAEDKEIQCPLTSNHRDINSVIDIIFPYQSFALNGYSSDIDLTINKQYNITGSYFGNTNDIVETINATANYQLNDNTLSNKKVLTNKLSNSSYISMNIPSDSCLQSSLADTIAKVAVPYSAFVRMKILQSGNQLTGPQLNATALGIINTALLESDGLSVAVPISGSITLNSLDSQFTQTSICDPSNIDRQAVLVQRFTPQTLPPSPTGVSGFGRWFFSEQLYSQSGNTVPTRIIRAILPESNIYNYNQAFKEAAQATASFPSVGDIILGNGESFLSLLTALGQYEPVGKYRKLVGGSHNLENLVVILVPIPIWIPPFIFFIILIPIWFWIDYPTWPYEINFVDILEMGGRINLRKDIYSISTYGKFDKTSQEKHFVINDLNGVRIYSHTGTLLWEKNDFCNIPFIRVENVDVGSYWNTVGRLLKIRGSFSHYDNHNLAKGGIRVGDFDGDGIDDLWCHYPGSTQNYAQISLQANQIIFDPFNRKLNTGDRCDFIVNLEVQDNGQGWCKDGVIKVGDFNGDKQSDVLCITNSNFYLLYGSSGTFYSEGIDVKGTLSLGTLISGWTKEAKIVVGDFDGDGFSDLAKINQNNIEVLYGYKNSFFKSRSDSIWQLPPLKLYSSDWVTLSLANSYDQCYNTDLNRIITGDIDGDGKDDIICIDENEKYIPLVSNTAPFTNPKNRVKIVVSEVELLPVNAERDIKRNLDLNLHTHNNSLPAGSSLFPTVQSTLAKKTVQDIYFPFSNFVLDGSATELDFSFASYYPIPENVLWKYGQKDSIRHVQIDVAAKWTTSRSNPNSLESNLINKFELDTTVPQGSCVKSLLANQYISMNINYNAKANIYITNQNALLYGDELKSDIKNIVNGTVLSEDNSFVTIPVQGHIEVNLLGVGYENINPCN